MRQICFFVGSFGEDSIFTTIGWTALRSLQFLERSVAIATDFGIKARPQQLRSLLFTKNAWVV